MGFNIGLSGIRAAASDLNITGNNIANSGTVGFKSSRAEFADVYAASVLGSGSNAQGSGVALANSAQLFTQGNIGFTENSLDLAINGNGFFVTSKEGALSYTRAGYFGTDSAGNIVNNAGERLQGFGVNAVSGQINQGIQTDLRVDTRSADPNATTGITSTLNLNSTQTRPAVFTQQYDAAYATSIATAATPGSPTPAEIATAQAAGLAAGQATFDPTNSASYNSSTSVNVFDSLGNSHVLTKYFVKNDANSWDMHVLIDGRDPQTGVQAADPAFTPNSSYAVQFNSVGELTSPQPYNVTGWAPLDSEGQPTGADSPVGSLAINLTGSSQYSSSFAVTSVTQDGFTTGELAGLEIDQSGMLVARYTNGQTKVQGQVVLATFANQQGLTPLGNTAWSQSFASGEPVVGAPATGTLGGIQSGALEASNVDISEQLIQLIVAQRNYQANAKTIQTEDAVTQTIINLR
ncbi:MAG TPA: flagellar hook protein FlgE [Pseudomonas sabulinigri]|jgi:flagellar hook protein FlgE|uniref:Flagellar hook protein FlgE n=1 Tax=marine sediment metagenome TaxID=412755 RepID=A0A0F9V708_9ZZZZ|nr:flagellar hook protein FlgE [Halopseudomonas sabulinigri]HEC50750.1 flagellar hook protein FlgE [Halopseudomonas sabulinigri]|tara:strand:- start:2414 stop:3805 length:1392 start_codon:yes stop_codon:yes gene_type:complete